jgi:enoyl-CoA hydratase/carnithine racemase
LSSKAAARHGAAGEQRRWKRSEYDAVTRSHSSRAIKRRKDARMTYKTLLYDVDDGLLLLRLNRPENLNAFTVEMANELVDVYGRASTDDAVRAIVVTGEGRAFCAGMDLSIRGNVFGLDESLRPTHADLLDRLNDPAIHTGVRDTGGRVALAMLNCLKPIIGAVNGAAVGIGSTMLLPMDFRLASEKARFGFVFGRLGITPEACSTWFLPRLVGYEQALEWFYRADVFDAHEALAKGLIRSVHPPETLVTDACKFARSLIADRSPVSVALIRQMVYRNAAQSSPLDAHRVESLAMFYTSLADGKEGVRAFIEKRPPVFTERASAMPPFFPWADDQSIA